MKKLYVVNLKEDIGHDNLKELFSEFGPVSDVKICIDEETGQPISNIEVYLPQSDRTGVTDANGVVYFNIVPLHYSPVVEVQVNHDYYTHNAFTVTMVSETLVQDNMSVTS
ncbi:MAG: hypothetical protein GY869_28810, partial [Planctomycetes bacterium]|nr:hypothetical protein [Planctomycetota bacterium]